MVGMITKPIERAVIWHDLECGSYVADLGLWRSLAERHGGGGVLELGCGTGRVALDLARLGFEVVALDREPALTDALRVRARERALLAEALVGDARDFALNRHFGLVLAPMQLAQLLGGSGGLAAMLERARAHQPPGGVLASALATGLHAIPSDGFALPLPDQRELGGWIFSSAPVAVRDEGRRVALERVRQIVDPAGGFEKSVEVVRLEKLGPNDIERAGRAAGYRPIAQRRIPETEAHVASSVVVLEAL